MLKSDTDIEHNHLTNNHKSTHKNKSSEHPCRFQEFKHRWASWRWQAEATPASTRSRYSQK
jgi:hypothetical protein